eukprot:201458-Amphidinium_carterae.1
MYRVSWKRQGSSIRILPLWHNGIWQNLASALQAMGNENRVSTRCGVVVRARGARSVSQEQSFDSVAPWNADGMGDEKLEVIRMSPMQVPEGVVMDDDLVHAPMAPRTRREHLAKFGYSATCQKSEAIMRDDCIQPF